jgi:hypothetical protein
MKVYLIHMPENMGMTQILAMGEGGVSFDGYCYGDPPTFEAATREAAEAVIRGRLGDAHNYISCEHDDPRLKEALAADLSAVEAENERLAQEYAESIRGPINPVKENDDAA